MNYRHAFHAGNHGDVLKHSILSRVLTYLVAKDKPLALLDTHAGIGIYDLESPEAFKTGEWRDGIAKLLDARLSTEAATLLNPYMSIVRTLNPEGKLQRYPGSPEIARALLRPMDRIILNELHPQDCATLTQRYQPGKRIRVTGVDANQSAKAELPFKEKRGLVLVDPAFEVTDESERVVRLVTDSRQRMANVCMLIWYPVTTQKFADDFCKAVAACQAPGMLRMELRVRDAKPAEGLAGSGLIAINPPWSLPDEANVILPALARILGQGKWGRGTVDWLTPPN